MIRLGVTFFLLLAHVNVFSQLTLVSDNFNDGNITSNPVWSGNTSNYTVSSASPLEGAYSLINGSTAGTISTIYAQYGSAANLSAANYIFTMLYRDNGSSDPTSLGAWENFTSTSANHWRFYLAANSTDPNAATGVCLEHSGGALKLIVRGGSGNGWEAGSYNISRNTTYSIKVIAKPNGNWELYVDAGTAEATTLRASQWPNLFMSGSHNLYMIFQACATSGNAGRFKFDNAGLFFKSLTVSQLTAGLADADLETGATNKALFGFAATASGGAIKIKNVKIQNSNNNNSGNFSNIRLYTSTDNNFATAGDNTLVSGASITTNGDRFDITGIEQTIPNGSTVNYFLVADITAGGASSMQFSMTCSGCGGPNTTVYTENSETVNNFSFSGNTYNFLRVCIWNNTSTVGNFTDDWQQSNAWENYVGPPSANDIVMFSKGGSVTPLNIPALSVKKIIVKNNTTVNITTASLTSGSRTLTVTGAADDDFEVEAGSTLNITSTGNTLGIVVGNGATGNIQGAVNFSGKNHTLTAAAASAITFAAGSIFTGGAGLTGNAFGSTTAGSVVFQSGSTLEDQVGLNYFSNANVITLQSGSNYKHSTTTTPSITNKTFGNLMLNTGALLAIGTNTFTINGSVTGSGALTMTSGTMNVSGDFSGTGTFTCGTGTINLNGTAQTIRGGTYATLNLSGAGVKTASGNISPGTALTVAAASTLDMGTNILGGSITTLSNNGTIKTANTSSTPIPISRTWGGTVEYSAAAGSQTIVAATYNNLSSSNGSNTNTTGGNITVNGTLTQAAGTLDLSTYTLSGTLTGVNNTGTIRTSNTTASPLPSDKNWGGTVQYAVASGGQTIAAGTYNNLTSSNSSNTNTAGGNLVVNGTLSQSAGILNLSSYTLSGTLSSITNNGTIRTFSTNASSFTPGKSWGGTIQYAATTGGQTVAAGTYNHLTLSNTGNINTAGGNITVNGTLTTTAGGTFNLGTNSLSGTLNSLNHNGILQTANAGSSPLPAGKTWGGTVVYNGASSQTIVYGNYNSLTLSNATGAALNGATVVESILTLTSGKLSLGSNNFRMNGTIGMMSAANSFTGSASATVTIGGSGTLGTLFFDQSGDGSTNTLKNLVINRTSLSGLVSLGNTLRIKDTLTPTAGTLNTDGNLVLSSTASGTARILSIDPALFALNGDVTVERYITAKTSRRWLFLASPVAGTTIRNGWQDDIFITGAGTGGTVCGTGGTQYNSNGFDASAENSPTIYTYDQANPSRWVAIPNTTSTNINKATGYRVLVRGNRNVNNACADQISSSAPPAPAATTLSVKGTLTTGNVNITISPKTTGTYGYTLIGNPYACEINFTSFYTANSSVITNKYWSYDPTTANTNYLTYNNGVVAGYSSGIITNANGNLIAPGQAFFVESVNGGTATFTESMKTSNVQQGAFKSNTVNRLIRTTFKKQNGDFIDNMVIRFSDDPVITTAENKQWDAATLNSGNFIAGIKGNRSFAIQTRPLNFYNDTVMVRIVSSTAGNYSLSFTEFQDFTEAAEIILLDLFAGTQTNVRQQPTYDFAITSNAASQGGRFKLVFRSGISVLPVSFISLNATQKNNGALLKWTVGFEQHILRYEVLKSNNGTSFNVIGKVDSKGNSNFPIVYEFTDNNLTPGRHYYRVRSIEKDGTVTLSNVVQLSSGSADGHLLLYPNPATTTVTLALPATQNKNWNIVLRTANGVAVFNTTTLANNTTALNIAALTAGIYYVHATNGEGTQLKGSFIKQ